MCLIFLCVRAWVCACVRAFWTCHIWRDRRYKSLIAYDLYSTQFATTLLLHTRNKCGEVLYFGVAVQATLNYVLVTSCYMSISQCSTSDRGLLLGTRWTQPGRKTDLLMEGGSYIRIGWGVQLWRLELRDARKTRPTVQNTGSRNKGKTTDVAWR